VNSKIPPRIGVLTYDLQQFTSALLERLQAAVRPMPLTAYPCFYHRAQQDVRVPALRSSIRPRPLGVSGRGVREALTSSVNVRAAWRLVSDNDIVILHGLQGATALLAVLLCKLRNRRAISVNHSLGPDMERRRRWWIRGLKRLLLGACDWHICQMPAAAETLAEVYGVPRTRMSMAPFEGGASLYRHMTESREERRCATRERLGIGPNETLYLFVGNVIPLKGQGCTRRTGGARLRCGGHDSALPGAGRVAARLRAGALDRPRG
jgi:Glycosyltransferase Family 4